MDYLQFEITGRRDGVVEIRLAGELDLASGSVVEVSLDHLLRTSDADTVVIDLRDLTYCDAAGLNVFSAAQRDAAKRGKTIVLANPRRIVSLVLDTVQFERMVGIERSGGNGDRQASSGESDVSESS